MDKLFRGGCCRFRGLGWINLHASLLPKYRGAAPIHWAIANGESVTGNTTMRIDAGMDTGEMLLHQELTIGPDETAPEVMERLSEAGADLMVETLRGLAAGKLSGRPQETAQATYAPILKREDGKIDWERRALEIYNHMRGFDAVARGIHGISGTDLPRVGQALRGSG